MTSSNFDEKQMSHMNMGIDLIQILSSQLKDLFSQFSELIACNLSDFDAKISIRSYQPFTLAQLAELCVDYETLFIRIQDFFQLVPDETKIPADSLTS